MDAEVGHEGAPSVHRPRRIGRQAGLGTVLTRARGHRFAAVSQGPRPPPLLMNRPRSCEVVPHEARSGLDGCQSEYRRLRCEGTGGWPVGASMWDGRVTAGLSQPEGEEVRAGWTPAGGSVSDPAPPEFLREQCFFRFALRARAPAAPGRDALRGRVCSVQRRDGAASALSVGFRLPVRECGATPHRGIGMEPWTRPPCGTQRRQTV